MGGWGGKYRGRGTGRKIPRDVDDEVLHNMMEDRQEEDNTIKTMPILATPLPSMKVL